jgi:hypothetical protein
MEDVKDPPVSETLVQTEDNDETKDKVPPLRSKLCFLRMALCDISLDVALFS